MKFDIARAWKDEAYRQSLSSEELAMLPESPAGEFELTEAEMEAVLGGHSVSGSYDCQSHALLCLNSVVCGTVAVLGQCSFGC